ncbi:timeless family protein, partial [Prunus dulcis]
GVDEASAFKHVSPNGTIEAEVRGTVTGNGNGNPLDAGSVQILEDLQHEQMDNDLVDSGDEMAHDLLLCFGLSCGYKFVIFDSVITLIEVEIKLGGSYGVLVCINDEDGEMKRRFAEMV